MDKLQPIITHKFWVFFSLALLLPLIGWWPATNHKNSEIEKQTTAINASFDLAKKDRSAFGNADWIKEITEVNNVESERLIHANYLLWKEQKKEQVWPSDYIREKVKKYDRISEANYKEIDRNIGRAYSTVYHQEVMKLYNKLQPYHAKRTKSRKLIEEGRIAIKDGEKALPIFDDSGWSDNPPNVLTVAEAQEDLWLLSSLVDAINAMNDGAGNISESTIKVIESIDFLGGMGRGQKQPESANKGNPNAPSRQPKETSRKSRNNLKRENTDVAYNPAEVFGEQLGITSLAATKQRRRIGGNKGGRDDDNDSSSRRGGVGTYTKFTPYKYQGNNRYVDLATKD